MDAWGVYQNRIEARGGTKRGSALLRETHMIKSKLSDNLSYQTVSIDGTSQEVAVINTDNLNEKFVYSLPGEDVKHGAIVCWMGSYWLVTERDANTTVYVRAKMIQCNYLLRWVSDDNTICEQWCVIEDGTKYLTGEYEDRNFIVTRGDSRIAMTITKNQLTTKFNRESRFMIDDPTSNPKLAYQLTKPLKVGSTYNDVGVFKFVLSEVNSTDNDNHELGIADYYKHFPREVVDTDVPDSNGDQDTGKKVWL